MGKKSVVICSPAAAQANNGNSHTATRWAQFLSPHFDIQIAFSGQEIALDADLMIALHAGRSATVIEQWHDTGKPCAVVLTGTDLYRDIHTDAQAQHSLELADSLVVLQEQGVAELPPSLQQKARVIYQSAPRLPTLTKPERPFQVAMVGHLRVEKDPLTFIRAAEVLAHREQITFEHFGQVLDPAFIAPVAAAGWRNERYHWHGGVSAQDARAALQAAHLSVLTSRMEGGAHVIIESVMAGTPVLASRISGNVGMLGVDYAGYFEMGDVTALCRLIERAKDDASFLRTLLLQCEQRAHLFEPEHEKLEVLHLAQSLLLENP